MDGETGNFTKDSRGLESLLENLIPRSLVPLRYLMTCFAASIWPGDGLALYLAIMLVIVAISGRVWVDNQFRDPTYLRRICISFSFSANGRSRSGTASTGCLDLYGVGLLHVAADSKPASLISSSVS